MRISKQYAFQLTVTFVAYFAVGWATKYAPFVTPDAVPIWFPTGVALFLGLIWGPSIWPSVLLALLLAEKEHSWSPIFQDCLNTLQPMLGAYLIRRMRKSALLTTGQGLVTVLAVGALAMPALGGTIWAICRHLTLMDWVLWVAGDFNGVLLLTPLLLSLRSPGFSLTVPRRIEAFCATAGLVLSVHLVFGIHPDGGLVSDGLALSFLIFPFMAWIGFRFGLFWTSATVLSTAAIAIWQTGLGRGPFYLASLDQSIAWLHIFVATVGTTSVILAAIASDKATTEEELKDSEYRYRFLFENNPHPMGVYDAGTLAFVDVNEAAIGHYGYSREEFRAMTILDICPLETVPALTKSVAGAPLGIDCTGIWKHRKKDGSVIDVEITRSRFRSGGHVLVLMLANDITERRRAEQALRESEERFKTLFNNALLGLYSTTPEGEVVMANPALCRMLGCESFEQLRGLDLEDGDFQPDYSREDFKRELEEKGAIVGLEATWKRLDGGTVIVRETAKAVRDESGKVTYYEGTIEDITDRRRIESEIRSSRDLLKLFIEHAPAGLAMFDRNMRYVQVSDRWCQDYHLQKSEIIGQCHYDVFKNISEYWVDAHRRCLAGESLKSDEDIFVGVKGKERWLRWEMCPWGDSGAETGGIIIFAEDITARKRAEEELCDSEAKVRNIFTHAPIGIFHSTVEGKPISVNPSLARILGYSSPEHMLSCVCNVPKQLFVYPEQRRELVESALASTGYVRGEVSYRKVDGTVLDANLYVCAVRGAGGEIDFVEGFVEDITERKRSEERRLASKRRFRELLESIRLFAVMLDLEGKLTFCNEHVLTSTNWSADELLGHSFTEFVAPGHRAMVTEVLESSAKGQDRRFLEAAIVTKSGVRRWVQWDTSILRDESGQIVGFACIGRDVTDHRELEQQFQQAQKMEAIGRLAGGIAHDINNVLQAVILPAELMLMTESRQRVREKLEGIVEVARRGASVAQQLLAFSRRQVVKPRVVDLNASLAEMHKMLRQLIREDIELVFDHNAVLRTVMIDPGQLVQIVINLVVNAQDAMPDGGRIVVRTADVKQRRETLVQSVDPVPDSYVEISVSDTGCGMTPEVREHAFEPFFTTKEFGRGTGLGLSTVYGIVQQCGGFVEVITELEVGTTMQIFLPVCRTELPLDRETSKELLRGSERVLLVEDEERVRVAVQGILAANGYDVEAADCGASAELLFTDSTDVLITDFVMPGKSGPELAQTLRQLSPKLRVLLMSGYAESAIPRELLTSNTRHLQKPFSGESLLSCLRGLLRETPV